MNNQANKRIDAGIKRGPRKPIDRRPRAALTGMFLPTVSPEKRQEVIDDAYQAIQAGQTPDQIGERHGVTGRNVRYWLLNDPKADQSRLALINGELTRTLEEMREAKHADSPLTLACAREEFRAWSWIAERREARLYGQNVQHEIVGAQPALNITIIQQAPPALPVDNVIEHEALPAPPEK